MAEGVEGAGLDERLDSPLVERARVDPATEVVEVRERAVGVAGCDDVLDDRLADIAHRRQAEDDHPEAARGRAARGGADRGEVRCGGIHVRDPDLDP